MRSSFSDKVRGISVCFARLNVMTFHRRVSPSTPPIWQHLPYKQAGMYATPPRSLWQNFFKLSKNCTWQNMGIRMRSLCRAKNSECVHGKQSQLLTCWRSGRGSDAAGQTAVVLYATQKVAQNERVKKSL